MALKKDRINHNKDQTAWKDRVIRSMQVKAGSMGRFKKLILIPMVIFLLVYHLVFGIYSGIYSLIYRIISTLKKYSEKSAFRETTIYAMTLIFFAIIVRISYILS